MFLWLLFCLESKYDSKGIIDVLRNYTGTCLSKNKVHPIAIYDTSPTIECFPCVTYSLPANNSTKKVLFVYIFQIPLNTLQNLLESRGRGGDGGGVSFSLRVLHTSDRALLWILHTLLRGFILPQAQYSMYFLKFFFFQKILILDSARCASWCSVQISFVRCSSIPRLCFCSLSC